MPRHESSREEQRTLRAAKMARKSRRLEKRAQSKREIEEIKEKLDRITAVLADHIKESDLRYRSLVTSTQLPIVAGVVFGEVFRIGMGRVQADIGFVEKRQTGLLSRVAHYADFGMRSEREMRLFASTWTETIGEQNSAAHTVCGDDVVRVLPFAPLEMALVLERGFQLIFRHHPLEWENATVEERSRRIPA